ncbi:MAG: HlyC/CorC family transporter [Lachnospiraceae bacterium]|nr:HlyC/CorC family transporter [Lachnospiraceae bacterium]MBD5541872.1 HlyC/CorC family transporter [Lachnospiraceae bacterium]
MPPLESIDPTVTFIKLFALFILLLLSSFFSSAETAFSTVSRIRIRTLCEEGDKRALTAQNVLDQYSKMLSAILIGNNIVNLSASSLTTTLAADLFGSVAVGIATGILTVLVLLFGEIVPKTKAMSRAEKMVLSYAKTIRFLMWLLTPVIFIIDKLSNALLRMSHIDPDQKIAALTESDLHTLIDVSHEDGVIESEEKEIIHNVFDFSDSVAKDIMIPRIHMTTLSLSAGYREVLRVFQDSMYTRIPVYDDDPDYIIGIINIKDFLLLTNKSAFHIQDILREVHYTYEFKNTADLMLEMREKGFAVSMVQNEYGTTAGMITFEDLLEEIVGEIRDEYDEDEKELIQALNERVYLIEGSMKLDDINDALSLHLESEDYDSIGGMIIDKLERLPKRMDRVTLEDGTMLEATQVRRNRIEKVKLILPEKEEAVES